MTYLRLLPILFAANFISGDLSAQKQQPATNYLHVTGPIKFNQQVYQLSWSSHPSETYYKQEYLVAGANVQQYKTMILLEALHAEANPGDLMAAKVAELKQLSATNPHISYESFYNKEKDEYLLDFVITQESPDQRSILIAERNVYRYTRFKDKKANSGVLLFGFSERRYGKDCLSFVQTVKSTRSVLSEKVSAFQIPVISL